MTDVSTYIGQELDVFSHAQNWKRYWSGFIRPYLKGDVLEVGAGIGTNTVLLRKFTPGRWVCLEPDAKLLDRLRAQCNPAEWHIEPVAGIVRDLPATEMFDSIIYIDVLEHIEHDAQELQETAKHLRPGGYLVVLCPAHQWLYTEFDKAIGHYRRYTKASMRAAGAGLNFKQEKLVYLDSVGLLASMGNAMLLKKSQPTVGQIKFWDRTLVPMSRILDPLVIRMIGKSVVGIWRKPG